MEETTTLIEYTIIPDMDYLFEYITDINLETVLYIVFSVLAIRLVIGLFKNIS